MERHYRSDRHAFWTGVRDGLLLIVASGIAGFALAMAAIRWELI